jgi:hypothetical protein
VHAEQCAGGGGVTACAELALVALGDARGDQLTPGGRQRRRPTQQGLGQFAEQPAGRRELHQLTHDAVLTGPERDVRHDVPPFQGREPLADPVPPHLERGKCGVCGQRLQRIVGDGTRLLGRHPAEHRGHQPGVVVDQPGLRDFSELALFVEHPPVSGRPSGHATERGPGGPTGSATACRQVRGPADQE